MSRFPPFKFCIYTIHWRGVRHRYLFQEECCYQSDHSENQDRHEAVLERASQRQLVRHAGRQMLGQVARNAAIDDGSHNRNAQGCSQLSRVAYRGGTHTRRLAGSAFWATSMGREKKVPQPMPARTMTRIACGREVSDVMSTIRKVPIAMSSAPPMATTW